MLELPDYTATQPAGVNVLSIGCCRNAMQVVLSGKLKRNPSESRSDDVNEQTAVVVKRHVTLKAVARNSRDGSHCLMPDNFCESDDCGWLRPA